MRITKIAFGWWEPFPVINWILDKFAWIGNDTIKEIPQNDSFLAGNANAGCNESGTGNDWDQSQREDSPEGNSTSVQGAGPSITEQVVGTPSGGDYTRDLRQDVLPCTSSMFALTFNDTTIKLLFGECPAVASSPERGAKADEKEAEALASNGKRVDDRQVILKTLRSIIERIQVPTKTGRSVLGAEPSLDETSATAVTSAECQYAYSRESSNEAVIKLDCSYNTVRYVVETLGLKESKGSDWDLLWTSRPIPKNAYAHFRAHQRANRFPESQTLVGKNNLAAYLNRMSGLFPREYDFWPKSWSLPKEWLMLEAHAQTHPNEWIIVKPHKGCGGHGIYLTQDASKLRKCQRMQSQVYIQRPFLIDNLKFDLRIYVLLTSCEPLRVFIYNEGLARFATVEYEEPNCQNQNNMFMHLTNYSLNKYSPTYKVSENSGTLRRFSTVLRWLISQNFDAEKIVLSIDDIVMKTIVAMLPTLKYNYYQSFPGQFQSLSTFQIFGFDVIFDRNLKAYVLEVNGSPSLQADVPLDIEMTNALVFDTFNLLNLRERPQTSIRSRIRWEDTHMGNFRRVYPNGNAKYYGRFMSEAEKFVLKNSRSKRSVRTPRSARSQGR